MSEEEVVRTLAARLSDTFRLADLFDLSPEGLKRMKELLGR